MMITINEYIGLTQPEQENLLFTSGIFVGKEHNFQGVSIVYQLETFYVKVIFSSYRKVVAEIKCYELPDDVMSYINQVCIDDLLVRNFF